MRNLATALMLAAATTTQSAAQDNDGGISLDGYIGLASDFRDRGLSLSDKDPALMGSVGLFSDSGFYGGVTAAIVDDGQGGDTKTEFYAGYQIDKGDYIYDLSFELDSFHGEGSRFYPEFKATMARDFGLAFIRGGASYAPDGRWSNPDIDSTYIFVDLDVPVPTLPELTVISRFGYDIRAGRSNLWDWGVGLSAFIDDVELSLMYEDSTLDQRIGNGAVILGAKFYF